VELQKLKEYLKMIIELEKQKFATEEMQKRIERSYSPSLVSEYKQPDVRPGWPIGWAITGALLGGLVVPGFFHEAVGDGLAGMIVLSVIVCAGILAAIGYQGKKKDAEKENAKRQAEYREAVNKNTAARAEADQKNQIIAASKAGLKKCVESTEETLKRLYSEAIIYPKYQNLIAITSIYEYLDSGRCTQLDGPDGAYNLFEMEVRLDRIVTKLDQIISRLDRIIENQHQLYLVVQEVTPQIERLANEVVTQTEQLNQIAATSAVTAYTTKVIERNQYYERNWNNGRGHYDHVDMP